MRVLLCVSLDRLKFKLCCCNCSWIFFMHLLHPRESSHSTPLSFPVTATRPPSAIFKFTDELAGYRVSNYRCIGSVAAVSGGGGGFHGLCCCLAGYPFFSMLHDRCFHILRDAASWLPVSLTTFKLWYHCLVECWWTVVIEISPPLYVASRFNRDCASTCVWFVSTRVGICSVVACSI